MTINFIGNFAHGYVGEVADETHMARELETMGHTVIKVPRDQWKAFVDGHIPNADWVLPDSKANITLIAKWPHFDNRKYIDTLKTDYNQVVFYWVWDYMDSGVGDWNYNMAQAADLYLTGEGGLIPRYQQSSVNAYYFQMDVCDGEIPIFANEEKIHDVIFTGSYFGAGNRVKYLKEINKQIPVKIWSWNHEEWIKEGFEAYPAVYGEEYNKLVAQSKLVLGFSVEPHCFGYWSNRVGKVLRAGGMLLQEFTPGMEQQLSGYKVGLFSSPEEAVEKIKRYLIGGEFKPLLENTDRWTSSHKMQELTVLMVKFLEEKKGRDWILS